MRHYKKGRKLGTDVSHTKAMKRSLVTALFLNDRIKTIESRAKEAIRGQFADTGFLEWLADALAGADVEHLDSAFTYPGRRRATCTPVVWPSPRSATMPTLPARSSRRSSRACGRIARAATPAS